MKSPSKITAFLLVFSLLAIPFSNNVFAEFKTYTQDDDGTNIIITEGEMFNVSVYWTYPFEWKLSDFDVDSDEYNSSVLKLFDLNFWEIHPWYHLLNMTFEGISVGSHEIVYHHYNQDRVVDDSFTLNVTVNPSNSVSPALIIIVLAIIIVVPSVVIIRWMKKDEKTGD